MFALDEITEWLCVLDDFCKGFDQEIKTSDISLSDTNN